MLDEVYRPLYPKERISWVLLWRIPDFLCAEGAERVHTPVPVLRISVQLCKLWTFSRPAFLSLPKGTDISLIGLQHNRVLCTAPGEAGQ